MIATRTLFDPKFRTATSSGRPSQGFTLVELLVVVAIITLLISILLPSLGKAREQAKTSACLANLHQVGIALMSYASEYHNTLPPGMVVTGSGYENWVSVLVTARSAGYTVDTYTGSSPPANQAKALPSVNKGIFRCPSDLPLYLNFAWDPGEGDPGLLPRTVDERAGLWRIDSNAYLKAVVDTSYGINGSYGYNPGWNWHDRYFFRNLVLWQSGTVRSLAKFNDIRQPARFALIFDGIQLFDQNGNRIDGRHGGRKLTNVLCADGHAETAQRKGDIPGGGGDFDDLSKLRKYNRFAWRLDQ